MLVQFEDGRTHTYDEAALVTGKLALFKETSRQRMRTIEEALMHLDKIQKGSRTSHTHNSTNAKHIRDTTTNATHIHVH